MSESLVGVDARLAELTGDDATLLGYVKADDTDKGAYYLALRTWPHPDLEDGWTLSLRYAYLTRGSGGDGWVGGDDSSGAAGINIRVEGDRRQAFLTELAQLFAAGSARVDGGVYEPHAGDATEE